MILLTFLLFLISGISAETHKFHHCFDRYNNHKIIGGRFIIQPFHSEWRIGGGEARCIGIKNFKNLKLIKNVQKQEKLHNAQ